MKTVAVAALMCLIPAMASAQDNDFYTLRWSLAGGPSLATPSGNKLQLTGTPGCTTCGRTHQRIVGADDGKYHASLGVAGDVKFNLTIRGELNYSHATSLQSKLRPRECPPPGIHRCFQDRKSLIDNAWYLGGGLEWAPYKQFPVVPYMTATGGVSLNMFAWNWDTTGTNSIPSTRAKAFGSYLSGGLGLRANIKSVILFTEVRRFTNFSTPGTAMAAYSLGLQYWLRLRNYGY